ncbi:arabinose efflux permease family protein [Cryptosporangium arvum DSM 44712]|uniref:Arabinose efflux permease family protein n=2 Tax=Cryptosporangium TaxID=65502 RepID=A0A010YY11_9ACTN|nr:MFS transporter [Cryptosporangium arvum]EXG80093.1 arabinose efflux permease family protein [Cryptosporangium arvum DSM 44712]
MPSRVVLVPIALAAFVTSLDNTVVNVALPSMQRDLALGVSGLQWIATSYILAFSALLLAGGRLTDLYGRRRVFLVGIGIFVTASALGGIATSGDFLIATRVLQGIGAALVLPSTLAVLATDVPSAARHLGAGVLTASIALSLALGPVVGGAVAEHWHWSWIFFLNVPVGLFTMVLGARTIGGSRASGQPVDVGGLITSTSAMFAVTYALIEGSVVAGGLAVAGGASFVVVERFAAAPMVDVRLFASRVFSGGTAAQVLWGLGINGVFFFTSLFLQDVMRLGPTAAGAMFVPLAVALVVCVPVSAALATRAGVHRTVAGGMALIAAGLIWVSFVGRGDPAWALVPGLVLVGVGSALTTPLTSAVLEVVPPASAGVAAAVISAAREVSGVLGIALVGAVVTVRSAAGASGGAGPVDAFASGYTAGLWCAAALTALGGAISLVALRPEVVGATRGDRARRPVPARRLGTSAAGRGRRPGRGRS